MSSPIKRRMGKTGPLGSAQLLHKARLNAWIQIFTHWLQLNLYQVWVVLQNLATTAKVFAEMCLNKIPPQIPPLYQQKKEYFFFYFCVFLAFPRLESSLDQNSCSGKHREQQVWSTPPAWKRSAQTLTHWQASFQPKQTSRMKCPICLQIKSATKPTLFSCINLCLLK